LEFEIVLFEGFIVDSVSFSQMERGFSFQENDVVLTMSRGQIESRRDKLEAVRPLSLIQLAALSDFKFRNPDALMKVRATIFKE